MVVAAEKRLALVEDAIGKGSHSKGRELNCSPSFATVFSYMSMNGSLNSLNLCSLPFMMRE